jgi:hypothetical protein
VRLADGHPGPLQACLDSLILVIEEVSLTVDFSGRWRNQRLSDMNLVISAVGVVSGTYHTTVGGPISGSIVGKVNGDQLVFFVDWTAGSMTTWAGQLLTTTSGSEVLETAWLHTGEVSEPHEPLGGWAGIRTGGDQFTRVT